MIAMIHNSIFMLAPLVWPKECDADHAALPSHFRRRG
jgi:hypothetical protein